MKKILSFLLALIMIVGTITPVMADEPVDKLKTSKDKDATTKTVTLHKLMMDKETLKKWNSDEVEKSTKTDTKEKDGYDATQDMTEFGNITKVKEYLGNGKTLKEVAGVYFAWQVKGKETTQVNGSTVSQYIKGQKSGDTMSPVFKTNPSTELELTTNIKEAFGGLTGDTGIKFDTSKLKGEFIITEVKGESTYQGKDPSTNLGKTIVDQKAVPVEITLPLVNSDGIVLNAHVYPKNTEEKPQIDKNFKKGHGLTEVKEESTAANETLNSGANVENYTKNKAKVSSTVGHKIPYEVKTKIEKDTSYERLVWNDTMTNGLTFDQESLQITVTPTQITLSKDDPSPDYTLYKDDRGFRLELTEAGLKKIKEVTQKTETKDGKVQRVEGQDVEITLQYTAHINGSAVVDNPEKNNIYLDYGHRPGKEIKKATVTPSNKEITVTKNFKEGEDVKSDFSKEPYKSLKLTYTLEDNNKTVASITLDSTMKSEANSTKTIDLGNGISFELGTSPFNGTFKGLKESGSYTFYERVSGFDPEYSETNNGTVTVTNKKDNNNPPPLVPTTPEVVTGGKKFVKTDDAAETKDVKRLMDAKFVVKKDKDQYLFYKSMDTKQKDAEAVKKAKGTYEKAIKDYNDAIKNATGKDQKEKESNVQITINNSTVKGKTEIMKKIAELREAYEKALKRAGIEYEFKKIETGKDLKEEKNYPDNIVILTSDGEGRFEIQGLAYGNYKLEEIKAPEGFAKIADQDFKVGTKSYEGNDKEIQYTPGEENKSGGHGQRVINKKVTIPQTGGIGTAIFTVIGASLMGAALFAMKRRKAEEN